MTQIKFTQVGKSYWDNNGAYQEDYNRLYEELVPSRGAAKTVSGELLRCMSRLTYDYYNNGNCNVIEVSQVECESCGGSGYDPEVDEDGNQDDCYNCGGHIYFDGDAFLNDYYNDMMEFLLEFGHDTNLIEEFKSSILHNRYHYGTQSSHIYARVTDSIMYQVLISDGFGSNPYYNNEENV